MWYLCLALKPLRANRKLSPNTVVKKEPGHKGAQWDSTIMQALYLLQLVKRHILGWSNVD